MAGWFKRFTLSLFSDNQAKESVKFGFGNILLTSFLAAVFMFFGIFAGKTVPFACYYDNAEEFRSFLYKAFSDGINITLSDGNADIKCGGKSVDINTLSNEADAGYSVNGYHLFVNSADVLESYDDFYAYCTSDDGKEIDYEEYLSLDENARKNYTFAVRYTGKIKNINSEDVSGYIAYLNGLNDEKINSQLNDIEENDADAVYRLYVQTYYPKLQSLTGEAVPTLRTYYYLQTLKTDGKYMCLFGDMMVVSFRTDTGATVSNGGTYKEGNGLEDGSNPSSVDSFIKNTFYDGASTALLVDLLNCIPVLALTELIILSAMLLSFAVCRLRKRGIGLKFADSARLTASYAHTGALLSALVTLCLSFLINGTAVSITAYVSFAVIMVIRTLILLLREKEQPVSSEEENTISD